MEEIMATTPEIIYDIPTPFLGYAVEYWTWHLQQSDITDVDHQSFLNAIDRMPRKLLDHWEDFHHALKGYSNETPSGITLAHVLSSEGIPRLLKRIVESGKWQNESLLNAQDRNGQTPISCAIESEEHATIEVLLATGQVDINLVNEHGSAPLSLAADHGFEAGVKLLLATGQVDINVKNSQGNTPLFLATERGHETIVELLVATSQADVDVENSKGETPLVAAAKRGNEETFKLMVAKSRFGMQWDHKYAQSLLLAAIQGRSEAIIKLILGAAQIDVSTVYSISQQPLPAVIDEAAECGNDIIVRLLLTSTWADAEIKSDKGTMPLLLAASNGHAEVVKLLLATGQVDVDVKGAEGSTPLLLAASDGHVEVVKLLLATGRVDVDVKNARGHTALFLAASYGHVEVVKLLLATGRVDVDVKNARGHTALFLAASYGRVEVVKLLLATGQVDINMKVAQGSTPLLLAALGGHVEVVKLLLATGQVDVDVKGAEGSTPLLLAALSGHVEVFKLLLATGQVDVDMKNAEGNSPLLLAARWGHVEVVKLLLATGQVDVDVKGAEGSTPLLLAARWGHVEFVDLLLATGRVDVNARDDKGNSPLCQAAYEDNVEVVKLLLATNQVDVFAKDVEGHTALFQAARGNVEIVELLLATGQVDVDHALRISAMASPTLASSTTSAAAGSASSLPLSTAAAGPTSKTDKLRALMTRYGIQFDGPVRASAHADCPRNLATTFEHIRRLGKTEFDRYKEAIAPDLRNNPWKEQVPRRACRVASLANACRSARKNEASWRLAVESEVMARFAVEVSCKTCRGRLWRSEQEVLPSCDNEEEREGTLKQRQRNRKPCACRSDLARDDAQEQGINPLFDDRADEAIVYYPEVQAILGKRKHRPDRIYGLRRTKRFERILYREDKRKPTANGKCIGDNLRTTPFHPDGEPILIDAQTAFAIRELLLVQDELRQAADDDVDWDAAPLAWFISYRGEQWRVSAAYIKWVNKQRTYRVVRLWHGEIDTQDGAIQLLLIIDYICDWARDKYREAIIQGLRSLASNDTRSLARDSDIFSTLDPASNPWAPPPPAWAANAHRGSYSGLVHGSVEQDPLGDLGTRECAVRDVRYVRSHVLGIYLAEDNFDYLMESTDSEEDSRELAAEILKTLQAAWRVERTALDLLELVWTGQDNCGSGSDPPDKGFLVVAGIGAYLSPEWEPSRTVFYFAVAESLVPSLAQVAGLDGQSTVISDLLRAPAVGDDAFVNCFSKFRRHSARDNLLACMSLSYVDSESMSPHATDKHDLAAEAAARRDRNEDGEDDGEEGGDREGGDTYGVGQLVHQIYKRHCIGRCKPSSSLFRISDRLDLVPSSTAPRERTSKSCRLLLHRRGRHPRGADPETEDVFAAVRLRYGPGREPVQGWTERVIKARGAGLGWHFETARFDMQGKKWGGHWTAKNGCPARGKTAKMARTTTVLRVLQTTTLLPAAGGDGAGSEDEDVKGCVAQQRESVAVTVTTSQSQRVISVKAEDDDDDDDDPIILERLEVEGFVELSFSTSNSADTNRHRSRANSDVSAASGKRSREDDGSVVKIVKAEEASPSKRLTRSALRRPRRTARARPLAMPKYLTRRRLGR
ncbi:unnamed protein product [Parascedosporium putredinis]|uniref:Ankyrin n=1 Tax=Parascedosporium putredinis TaxID=1442378 RepID=A0A9P1MAM8_9PEZI|nr:unnamed protein product [Parascedosporium putredinis]CAI7994231.1 unnamed protein product [Parascedosporium putredinis]